MVEESLRVRMENSGWGGRRSQRAHKVLKLHTCVCVCVGMCVRVGGMMGGLWRNPGGGWWQEQEGMAAGRPVSFHAPTGSSSGFGGSLGFAAGTLLWLQ